VVDELHTQRHRPGLRSRVSRRIGTAGMVAALGALVVVGLVVSLIVLVVQASRDADSAQRSVAAAEASAAGFDLYTALRTEDGLASLAIGGAEDDQSEFAVQAARTDAAWDAYTAALVEAVPPGNTMPLVDLSQLDEVRQAVVEPGDTEQPVGELYEGFASQIRESLSALALFATDADELRLRRASLALVEVVDVLSRRRDLVTSVVTGTLDSEDDLVLQLSIYSRDRTGALRRAMALMGDDGRQLVRDLLDSEASLDAQDAADRVASGGELDPGAWFDLATDELAEVTMAASAVTADLIDDALVRLDAATRRRSMVAIAGGLLVVAAVLAAWAARVASRERVEALAEHRALVDGVLRWFGSDAMPAVDEIEVEARYIPAAQLSGAGGDWYDVFRDPEGRVGLVVGDVAGHGAEVVARMTETRSMIRAMAHAGVGGPARQLERVDAAAESLSLTTVLYGLLDLADGTLTYSRAGHLPGVLRRSDGTVEYLYHGADTPIGLPGTSGERTEAVVSLNPGDTVVLFTDGLVEERAEDVLDGIAAMADRTIVPYEGPLTGLADALVAQRPEISEMDDASILVVRRRATSGLDVEPRLESGDLEDAGHGV
jgi:hypothetical protein